VISVKSMDNVGNADHVENTGNAGSEEYGGSMENDEYTMNGADTEGTEEPTGRAEAEGTEEPTGRADTEGTEEPTGRADTEGTEKPTGRADTEGTERPSGRAEAEGTEEPSGRADAEEAGYAYNTEYSEDKRDRESTEKAERKRSTDSKRDKRSGGNMGNTVKKKKLTGSFAAKVAAFFLLAASVAGAVAGSLITVYLVLEEYYAKDMDEIFLDECTSTLLRDVYLVRDNIAAGNLGYAREICEGKNLDIALMDGDLQRDNGSATDNEDIIWTTYTDSYEIGLTKDIFLQFPEGDQVVRYTRIYAGRDYVFRVYFNMDFPEKDEYAEIYNICVTLYNMRYIVLWILGISIFIGLNSFLFLMYSAGHRNDMEGIQPTVFSSIPLDLYTAFYGMVAFFLLIVLLGNLFDDVYDHIINLALFSAMASAEALWCTFYLRELAVRMKLGGWWKNSVIYRVLRLLGRMGRLLWKGICVILREIPSILGILLFFIGVSILELLTAALFGVESDLVVIWMAEKVILFPVIIYIAMMCRRLLNGSRALAEGRQEEIIDTSYMFGDFKECGENLNNIGQGISRAVAERMKSEHLKTELITNVSHDIKTPLTSIINYANLIAEEHTENEKITEYSEVLVRQSGRMKKLLEDLLEASKATTGNLEVDLQPCEVSVILSQAIGEYQQRMEEKQLELIVTQPEEAVNIMADGRRLWRVFDNLLNNICKYAREDSRVYLNVETAEGKVNIIFRNMSKYALNIMPEELQERFVRGDRSRHMDGNGLGLSIAKSLTELQNGRMEIVTDGDLFKVILSFEVIKKL